MIAVQMQSRSGRAQMFDVFDVVDFVNLDVRDAQMFSETLRFSASALEPQNYLVEPTDDTNRFSILKKYY